MAHRTVRPHCIVPPYLWERIAAAPDLTAAAGAAARTLERDRQVRPPARVRRLAAGEIAATGPKRTVCDAHSTERLPGDAVRREGEPAGGDAAVNEAYDGLGATYTFYREAFHRNSIDGRGLPLDATVHYGSSYDNAFWNGDRMVFGDGDGDVFQRFTLSVSVIGHELTHGVTQYSANLDYRGQSGALNEHVSDVFGALVEQFRLGQSADRATWLIGAGLFTPKIKGTALRSMKQPGAAYDDPVLGKDPQPATMSGYVATDDDMGGVHLNCGIPNHAFYLAASELGGYAWERAGRIWYRTLTDAKLPSDVNFAGFAAATARTAADIYGQGSAEHNAVQAAWRRVEVTPNGAARA